jgi:hypothetical protein
MKNIIKILSNIKLNNWAMLLFFVLIISFMPLFQFVNELRSGESLQEFDVFKQVPKIENLRAYEDSLNDSSVIAKKIRPLYQWFTTSFAKRGNGKVVIGKDGWLFYRPSVDYVIKPVSTFDRDMGPLPAIIAFHETLKAQGVDLILLPISGKATIYPEYLSKRYNMDSGPPDNFRTAEFFDQLRDKGITVLNPAKMLWDEKAKNAEPLYIKQDTHWSPLGMELVVQLLSQTIKNGKWLTGVPQKLYNIQPMKVTNFGDLYDMLGLTWSNGFNPIDVNVGKIIDVKTKKPCISDPKSSIILLGDSFVNVFSKEEMKWGDHGGFSEHLALHLGIPIDVIAINNGGASISRESLARRPNALVGKKLVIWQFATRDLVNPESNWNIVKISPPSKKEIKHINQNVAKAIKHPKDAEKERSEEELAVEDASADKTLTQGENKPEEQKLAITAEVIKVSMVPDPDQVAYTECLTYIKYRVITVEHGEYKNQELLAVFWGMKNSKLMPAAHFKVGEKQRLVLDPFDEHKELSHIMQADDTNDYESLPFWVLKMSSLN